MLTQRRMVLRSILYGGKGPHFCKIRGLQQHTSTAPRVDRWKDWRYDMHSSGVLPTLIGASEDCLIFRVVFPRVVNHVLIQHSSGKNWHFSNWGASGIYIWFYQARAYGSIDQLGKCQLLHLEGWRVLVHRLIEGVGPWCEGPHYPPSL